MGRDLAETIFIREGDRPDDVVLRFGEKHGLGKQDQDVILARLKNLLSQNSRIATPPKKEGGPVLTPTVRPPTVQPPSTDDSSCGTKQLPIPSNLSSSQRNLFLKTLAKGVAAPTPWRTKEHLTPKAKSKPGATGTPVLRLHIDIAKGKTARLLVHEGEDLNDLASNFVREHNLPPRSAEKLKKVLEEACAAEQKRVAERHRQRLQR